jgi:uncharacterized protein
MTQPAKAQEPSMEEILASIRRIIADDDASKAAQRPMEPPKAAAPAMPPVVEVPALDRGSLEDQASDILDLTESMAAPSFARPEPAPMPSPMPSPPTPAPQFRKIDGESDVAFDEAAQKPLVPNIAQAPGQHAESEHLISNATSAAVDSAFNALAQTVLAHNARTLEDLVREMLRPMLKSWLDDNLPNLVERLVRAEIERVARGR